MFVARNASERIAILFALLAVSTASAQTPPAEEDPLVNFVFASQLGSGIYAGGDGTVVQVYRIPYDHTLRELEGNPFGVQLRLSLTPGFYDFDVRDIFEGVLPSSVGTITVTAGAAFPVRLGRRWRTAPMGEIGYGQDFTRGIGSPLYTIGLLTEGELPRRCWTHHVRNRLTWTKQTQATAGFLDELLRLQTSFESRRPIARVRGGRLVDIGLFVANHTYFDSIDFFRFPQAPVVPFGVRSIRDESIAELQSDGVTAQWEFGTIFGVTPNKVWKIPVPRVGISYRFGTDTSAWRLVLGGVF